MKKILLSLALIGIPSLVGYSQGNFEADKISALLASKIKMLQEMIEDLKRTTYAPGTVQQSFLNEDQFTASMGEGWVLCDGRDTWGGIPISETAYGKLTQNDSVPDCRGLFLRSSGGEAGVVGEVQSQATAVAGLKILSKKLSGTFSTSHAGSHSHNMDQSGEHSHGMSAAGEHSHGMDEAGAHRHKVGIDNGIVKNGKVPISRILNRSTSYTRENMTDTAGSHTHVIHNAGKHTHVIHNSGKHTHKIHNAGNHTHSVDVSFQHGHDLSGDRETRPSNMAINTYIKVN